MKPPFCNTLTNTFIVPISKRLQIVTEMVLMSPKILVKKGMIKQDFPEFIRVNLIAKQNLIHHRLAAAEILLTFLQGHLLNKHLLAATITFVVIEKQIRIYLSHRIALMHICMHDLAKIR